ncbi:MAG TPA: SOS response-associated peptidase [Kineosporiaceae bacterium]|nr:SOS response-associated peptidase [Kineosporiaceae bacterium]
MCGRYANSRRPEDLVETFEVERTAGRGPGQDPSSARPDYNVAPTRPALVVLRRRVRDEVDGDGAPAPSPGPAGENGESAVPEPGEPPVVADADGEPTADAALEAAEAAPASPPAPRMLRLLTWGLIPSWAKDRKVGGRMINARAESLLDKPAFRRAALTRRCLVPADGWYEWQKSPTERDAKGKPRRQPFWIHPGVDRPIAFAGVYEFWRDPTKEGDDAWVTTFAIITTEAEHGLDVIHDRMPFVVPEDRWDDWLDPDLTDPDAVRALLRPPVPGRFVATAVSMRVNAVANNGPDLLEPVPLDQLHGVVDPATGELIGAGEAPLF